MACADRGWRIFPLIPNGKRPAVTDWEHRATGDRERIERCWTHAPYNIGVACGPSKLVVIDLDVPKGPQDTPPDDWHLPGVASGADVLAVLCERHGQRYPSETLAVATTSGGRHLYFATPTGAAPAPRNTCGTLGWKIDTRGAGGYVVAPGCTIDGRPYTVAHLSLPAQLPTWLADLLTPAPLPPQQPVVVALPAADRRGKYLTAAIEAEVERVRTSPGGGHNNALYRAAVALGQLVAGGELTEAEVTTRLSEAARTVGQGPNETHRTITSGLNAGANRPRTVAA
jgi:hypothetical protein